LRCDVVVEANTLTILGHNHGWGPQFEAMLITLQQKMHGGSTKKLIAGYCS
jgi:hypothetical protein